MELLNFIQNFDFAALKEEEIGKLEESTEDILAEKDNENHSEETEDENVRKKVTRSSKKAKTPIKKNIKLNSETVEQQNKKGLMLGMLENPKEVVVKKGAQKKVHRLASFFEISTSKKKLKSSSPKKSKKVKITKEDLGEFSFTEETEPSEKKAVVFA